MPSDNLIRLNQTESGEFSGFMAEVGSGHFYPLSDPSGLATQSYVGTTSGALSGYTDEIKARVDTASGDLNTKISTHGGIPSGSAGQVQFKHASDSVFDGADHLYYDGNVGIGGFSSSSGPQKKLHVSGDAIVSGNLDISGGGQLMESGVQLSASIASTGSTLNTLTTNVSGYFQKEFKVTAQSDGSDFYLYLSDVIAGSHTATAQSKTPTVYLQRGETYKFDISSSTLPDNSAKLYIATSTGTLGNFANAYPTGVNSGDSSVAGGNATSELLFTVPQG